MGEHCSAKALAESKGIQAGQQHRSQGGEEGGIIALDIAIN